MYSVKARCIPYIHVHYVIIHLYTCTCTCKMTYMYMYMYILMINPVWYVSCVHVPVLCYVSNVVLSSFSLPPSIIIIGRLFQTRVLLMSSWPTMFPSSPNSPIGCEGTTVHVQYLYASTCVYMYMYVTYHPAGQSCTYMYMHVYLQVYNNSI